MSSNDSHRITPEVTRPLPLDLAKVEADLAGRRRLSGRLHYLPKVDSTNNYARHLAENGAPEGEIVIAEEQTQGRGRLGRVWASPSHANIYLSVILRPAMPPANAPQLTLMSAVALADCIASFINERPAIKWPNDILVGGRKVAGILTESCCSGKGIEFVILGIGVNVNFPLERMPASIHRFATSLMVLRREALSRETVCGRLIQDLDRCYGILEESGFQSIGSRWESYFGLRGQIVRIESIGECIYGKAIGIDGDGALIIEDEHGRTQRVIAGDVSASEG